MKTKCVYRAGTNTLKAFLLTFFLILLMSIAIVSSVEAAIENYTDDSAAYLEANSDEIFSMSNNLIYPNGNVAGDFVSTAYRNGSIYTYVLEVTPDFVNSVEFNLGRDPGSPDKGGGYNGIYGYDFEEAKIALVQYGTGYNPGGTGDDIFQVTLDSDNTIDWNLTSTYLDDLYAWQAGSTITFFFEHTSAPVEGFYSVISGTNSAKAIGLTPAPVPVPGTLLLLASSMLGLLTFRKVRRK